MERSLGLRLAGLWDVVCMGIRRWALFVRQWLERRWTRIKRTRKDSKVNAPGLPLSFAPHWLDKSFPALHPWCTVYEEGLIHSQNDHCPVCRSGVDSVREPVGIVRLRLAVGTVPQTFNCSTHTWTPLHEPGRNSTRRRQHHPSFTGHA